MASSRPLPLPEGGDVVDDPRDRFGDGLGPDEREGLEVAEDGGDGMPEVHPFRRPAVPRVADLLVERVGHQPGSGDHDEAGVRFPEDAASAFGAEGLDGQEPPGGPEHLLDAPARPADACRVLDGEACGVADQPELQRPERRAGVAGLQPGRRPVVGADPDQPLFRRAGEEGDGLRVRVPLEPEHGVPTPDDMGEKHPAGEAAPVVDDHVPGGQGPEVPDGGAALAGVGVQAEVGRQPRLRLAEAADQALRVVCMLARHPVSGIRERTRQVDPGAVDAELSILAEN